MLHVILSNNIFTYKKALSIILGNDQINFKNIKKVLLQKALFFCDKFNLKTIIMKHLNITQQLYTSNCILFNQITINAKTRLPIPLS